MFKPPVLVLNRDTCPKCLSTNIGHRYKWWYGTEMMGCECRHCDFTWNAFCADAIITSLVWKEEEV